MRLSLLLGGMDTSRYVPIAKAADELGYESVWLSDHLIVPVTFTKDHPYTVSGDAGLTVETPLIDPWVMIGHLAAATKRIFLGTGIYLVALRDPFATARAAATAQDLSHGRVLFGIGSGWLREEFEVVGAPFGSRGSRITEIVEILRALWTGQPVSHTGRWYSFREVQFRPAPAVRIPILFGGISQPVLQRAVEFGDGWFGPPVPLAQAASARDAMYEGLKRAGRNSEEFAVYARADAEFGTDLLKRASSLGLDRLVIHPPPDFSLAQQISYIEAISREVEPGL
jgi:probable F420-dependent oxidoreductase